MIRQILTRHISGSSRVTSGSAAISFIDRRLFSPKGIRISAQGKRVVERRPGFRMEKYMCPEGGKEYAGRDTARNMLQKSCQRFPCPCRAISLFRIKTQGGARRRACPGLVSAPLSGEKSARAVPQGNCMLNIASAFDDLLRADVPLISSTATHAHNSI